MKHASFSEAGAQAIDLGDGRRLRLGAVLGKGAMSVVYRGVLSSSNGLRRSVAVKLFSAISSEEADQVLALLERSARRVACIEHPNVVGVYECGVFRGQPFIISELVPGVTLRALQEAHSAKHRRVPL